MYKDEIWYRKLEQALDERRDAFTDKEWGKYNIEGLRKVANRVRQFSESCPTCTGYQHTLTRLEEELQELPDSKAQRQYQAEQLKEMGAHFVQEHELAPPKWFFRKYLRLGLIAGSIIGFLAMLVVGNLLLFPLGLAVGAGAMALYGRSEDAKIEREHRLI